MLLAVDFDDGVAFEDHHALWAVVGVQRDSRAALEQRLPVEEDLGSARLGYQRDGARPAAARE
nr:hypothetical protein [Saccharopolyspora sp. S2-29]